MFSNAVYTPAASNSNTVTNHTLWNSFSFLHALPLFILGVILFIIFCFMWAKDKILAKLCPGFLFQKIRVSENLPSYLMALSAYDKNYMLCEEKELREKHDLPMLTDEFYNKLEKRDAVPLNMLVDSAGTIVYREAGTAPRAHGRAAAGPR